MTQNGGTEVWSSNENVIRSFMGFDLNDILAQLVVWRILRYDYY